MIKINDDFELCFDLAYFDGEVLFSVRLYNITISTDPNLYNCCSLNTILWLYMQAFFVISILL